MTRWLLRRAAAALVVIAGLTAVTFFALRVLPADPLGGALEDAGRPGSSEARRQIHAALGLDDPLPSQYLRWLGGALRGDLGASLVDGRTVTARISERLRATLLLTGSAAILGWSAALLAAALLALGRGALTDRAGRILLFLLAAIPVFWGGMLLQRLFAIGLHWLPLHGMKSDGMAGASFAAGAADRARHLVLPMLTLALPQAVFIARIARTGLLEAMGQPFALAARARGLTDRQVVLRHALPQTGVSLVQLAGFSLPGLIAGSLIVERLFSWPGLGGLLFDAISAGDFPVVMGLTLLTGAATLAGTLLADLAAAWLDPRIRLSGAAAP